MSASVFRCCKLSKGAVSTGIGVRCLKGRWAARSSRMGRGRNPRYGQTVDETGSGKPAVGDRRRRARGGELDPIRRISIRARGMPNAATRGRTHVSTRPSAQTKEQYSLASDGASAHLRIGALGILQLRPFDGFDPSERSRNRRMRIRDVLLLGVFAEPIKVPELVYPAIGGAAFEKNLPSLQPYRDIFQSNSRLLRADSIDQSD